MEAPQERVTKVDGGGTGAGPRLAHESIDNELPVNAWAIAGLVVMVIVVGALLMGRHRRAAAPNGIQPVDRYAASLPVSDLAMSESTSLSGGKSTFIDGHVRNTGSSTVTAITVQVLFRNDEAMPPQVETLPLALIRTHEPYVDTMPVGSSPIKPGEMREFRLIFETLPRNWNQQVPDIRVIRTTER